LTVPSGYTYWGKIDLTYAQEVNSVASTDGQVSFAALWKQRRFDFLYGDRWYNHAGETSDEWLERQHKRIRFNGCL
jgi:hypothetical protein